MNKIIYRICLLGFLFFSVHAMGQSKIEQLEAKLATAAEEEKTGIYNELSIQYYASDAQKSLENGKKALEGALATEDIGAQAKAHINMGMANHKLKNYNDAIGNYKGAKTIYETHNSKEGVAYTHIQLGVTYNGMKNTSSAISNFQKAFDAYNELKNNVGMAGALMSMGDAYLKTKKTNKAIAKYKESIPYYEGGKDNKGLAHVYNKIGAAYSNFGNFSEAKKMLTKAMDIAKANNLSRIKKEIDRNLQIVTDNEQSTVAGKSEFAMAEEAKVEEQIQELEDKSSQLQEQTSDFLSKINQLTGEKKIIALMAKVSEDALGKEKLLKEKKEQELALEIQHSELQSAELEKKNAIVKQQELVVAQQQTQLLALIGGVVFLAAIAFLILNRYQQKKKANTLLSQQNKEITEQKEEISGQKEKLEVQKSELERTNTQISDSIDYAKRIQSALLSSQAKIESLLPESFVLFKPKAVVSGDFYWVNESNGKVLFAAADCTGHGVPGAFMSIISNNVLDDIISQRGITNPGQVLKSASDEIIDKLQDKDAKAATSASGATAAVEVKDGMDIALCSLDKSTLQLQYAGAHNPLYLIRNGELIEYRGDRLFIGNTDDSTVFKTHDIQLQKGDMLYVFSDGFPDQKGGANKKKFYYKPFQDMLLEVHKKPMEEQHTHLDKVITDWIGDNEQIDDILIFGIRV
ncbi:MAG: tetratricopeptide repeat protein [Flavobacteriales bacterium]|nr:tetratricopeptide repeat protein [Flavobacteriales bacterium]